MCVSVPREEETLGTNGLFFRWVNCLKNYRRLFILNPILEESMTIRILSIFVLIFVLCIGVVLAQTTSGSITGNVVDAQRSAIANATVTITDVDKGSTQTAT